MSDNRIDYDIKLTFFEPFRMSPWVKSHARAKSKTFFRTLSFVRWLETSPETKEGKEGDSIGVPFIPGTLLRSALLKEVEFLITLKNKYDCCCGEFETPRQKRDEKKEQGRRFFGRKRPTYEFGNSQPCTDFENACPFCSILSRSFNNDDWFDDRGNPIVGKVPVHFSNLDVTDSKLKRIRLSAIANQRIVNRVDFRSGKAQDYFKIWEVDNRLCPSFCGKITIRQDINQVDDLTCLLAAGLAKIKTLAGALCRVDIIRDKTIDFHQRLIQKYVGPPGPPHNPTAHPTLPSQPTLSVDVHGLARTIAGTLTGSDKEAYLRRIADAVREMRNRKCSILHEPPFTKTGDKEPVWTIPAVQKALKETTACVARESWRLFCEELGEALYKKAKELKKKDEAIPRLLGDTEYYGQQAEAPVGTDYRLTASALPKYEWIINGWLEARTPFFFGVESASEQTSLAILLTRDHRYRLPRSVLRGALRRDLRTVIGSGCNVELGVDTPCDCDVCRIMSRVIVMDSLSDYQEPPDIRHRIRINQHSGTVDEGALFDMELGPEGLRFPFRMYFSATCPTADVPLAKVLKMWQDRPAFLGGDAGTGNGRFRLIKAKTRSEPFDWDGPKSSLNLLMARSYIDLEDHDTLLDSKLECAKAWKVKDELTSVWTDYQYEIDLHSPILSNDPIAALLDPDWRDAVPVKKRVLQDGGLVPTEKYYIKGSGIRGILRTAVGRNCVNEDGIHLHNLPHDDCPCVLCQLFGSEHHQGMLRFEDAHFENDPMPETLDHVAIDRFTGRARDKFKFEDAPLIATPDQPIKLKGTFWLKRELHEASQEVFGKIDDFECKPKEDSDSLLGAARALWCAFLDLKHGLFPIGSNGGIGYGWVSGLSVSEPDKNKKIPLGQLCRNEGAQETASTSGEKGEYNPSDAPNSLRQEGHVFNPHYFLRSYRYEDKNGKIATHVERIDLPVTHEAYQDKLTGKITCKLNTRGPVFVADPSDLVVYFTAKEYEDFVKRWPKSAELLQSLVHEKDGMKLIPVKQIPKDSPEDGALKEISEHQGHKGYKFFRLNGSVMIPGSEIRGMVSSVYEALTNSCFRVFDQRRILSKRMEADFRTVLTHFKAARVVPDNNSGSGLSVKEFTNMVRVPVYNCPQTFFDGLTQGQISGKEETKLWVKNYEWRISLCNPWTHHSRKSKKEWEKNIPGRILNNQGDKIVLNISYKQEERKITLILDDKDRVVLDGITPKQLGGKEEIRLWLRISQYQKAFRKKPDNNGGWKMQTGYLHIMGPNKVEIDSSGTSREGLQDLPETWKDAQCNSPDGKIFSGKDGNAVYTMNKYCEMFFYNEQKKSYRVPQAVLNQYRQMIEESMSNPQAPPAIFRSKPIREKDTALKAGDLVYFRKNENREGEVDAVIPVRIYRESHRKPLGKRFPDGLHDLRPCTFECLDDCDKCPDRCNELKEFFNPHPKGLCPACRLFGTTSYKSRVSFGFARLCSEDKKAKWYGVEEDAEQGKPLTLPLLERPRPTWSMPDKDAKIPGRKFYVHHPHSVDSSIRDMQFDPELSDKENQGKIRPNKNNRTVEPLDKGNEFTFDIRFMNLKEWELGLLLYSLQLETGLAHKLGMGKAQGFGSVEIDVEKVEIRNGPGDWKSKTSHKITEWITKGKDKLEKWFKTDDWNNVDHIADLKKFLYFLDPQEIKPKVRYPSLSRDDDKKDHFPGYVDLKRKPSKEKPNPYYVPEDKRRALLTRPWEPWYVMPKSSMGTVKWFNEEKNYGFILRDNGEDIFVHRSDINGSLGTLTEGQKVIFEVKQGPKGLQATNVKVIS